MSKLFYTLLLALGVMSAIPAATFAAGPETPFAELEPLPGTIVPGGHLYIQDPTAPILISFGSLSNPEIAYATHISLVYIAALDDNGNMLGGWQQLFTNKGTAPDIAGIDLKCLSCLIQSGPFGNTYLGNSYTYTPADNAAELVFMWRNITNISPYYFSSGAVDAGYGANSTDLTGNVWDTVKYYSDNLYENIALIGLEDGGGTPKPAGAKTDWDWNDILFTVTNVGLTKDGPPPPPPPPPAIPEPGTYSMMLVGLGLLGAVARRRKKK